MQRDLAKTQAQLEKAKAELAATEKQLAAEEGAPPCPGCNQIQFWEAVDKGHVVRKAEAEFQRWARLSSCGHVYCMKCLETILEEEVCPGCEKEVEGYMSCIIQKLDPSSRIQHASVGGKYPRKSSINDSHDDL